MIYSLKNSYRRIRYKTEIIMAFSLRKNVDMKNWMNQEK